ncbi:MAG: circularly permuted type 2 ATP-grasp protein [Rhodoferax sp.]|nr:circularly permuted type 2 ATP-grasp protein [Rhodoferax sp.]
MLQAPQPDKMPGPTVPKAAGGHYDELRGGAAEGLSAHWSAFFDHPGAADPQELNLRSASLERQVRDNGVTYNVYADAGGPQRPWSLDLFPLILTPDAWKGIETGVLQRVRLLDRVMQDVYGPQQLLARGLLPPALVQGHPGYLRSMHGAAPVGGTHLHIAAFDLARGVDGNWWLVSQRTQAPSGLGYLLENRLAVSRQFPQAFENMHVQRLAGTYQALIENLKSISPGGREAHIGLLTPGPYNETYFEHAYLARYLGLTLVEGGDMLVRDQRLYLKTLKGLVPIHALLKRMDDQFLDPLELRPDSTLGVPGLLQAVRAGNLLVANAPGSEFLESPALLGFLPALARHVLGEELALPALPTWWCGERNAMEEVLPRLAECAIKPTYQGAAHHGSFEPALGHDLSARELDEWAGRIARQGDDHTIQAYLPLAQMPTWQRDATGTGGRIVPRSVMLRVFAVANGPQSWQVLPGGLARVAHANAEIATMQRGGSSADVWVMTRGAVDRTTLLAPALTPGAVAQRKRLVTSRAAENLYWLGRYTERTENTIALARLTLGSLNGEDQSSPPLLAWLGRMAVANSLVLAGVPSPVQARRVFERSLIASLGSEDAASVGYNLRSVRIAGSSVRERLSQEHWNMIVRAQEGLTDTCTEQARLGEFSTTQALDILNATARHMAAITGAQTDRMTRDDGWRLLSIGRHIERLGFLSRSLTLGLETASVHCEAGFEAMVALFDSTITFHAQFQQSREMAAMIDLLVLDRDNPRSLAWVAHTLRGRLAKLAGSEPNELSALSLQVPNPNSWNLDQLCMFDALDTLADPAHQPMTALANLLAQCNDAAFDVSEVISATYFTHSGDTRQSVGA